MRETNLVGYEGEIYTRSPADIDLVKIPHLCTHQRRHIPRKQAASLLGRSDMADEVCASHNQYFVRLAPSVRGEEDASSCESPLAPHSRGQGRRTPHSGVDRELESTCRKSPVSPHKAGREMPRLARILGQFWLDCAHVISLKVIATWPRPVL